MPRAARSPRRALALAASLSLLIALPTIPALGADAGVCIVTNATVDPATTFERLDEAVAVAAAGDRLVVEGTCIGPTIVDKDLTIEGLRIGGGPEPTLDGAEGGSVILVAEGATVAIATLTITGGTGTETSGKGISGGGILNRGSLTLTDVTVQGNRAGFGGGIYNDEGEIAIAGASIISDNSAKRGGGLYNTYGDVTIGGTTVITANAATQGGGGGWNYGVLTLLDTASITDNRTSNYGGGVENYFGTLIIDGSAAIHANSANYGGGGVDNSQAELRIQGSSAIHGNTAPAGTGAGVANHEAIMDGAACGVAVRENDSEDCSGV